MKLVYNHLIYQACVNNKNLVEADESTFRGFLEDLSNSIGMECLIDPIFEFSHQKAWTGLMGIITSHISFHYWTVENFIQFDLYSCKKFDLNKTIQYLNDFWKSSDVRGLFIEREPDTNFIINEISISDNLYLTSYEKARFNIPAITTIIERKHNGVKQILVQTRWKPKKDPKYSGTIEIPGGCIERYENVYDAVKREVLEETGLKIINITPDNQSKLFSPREDGAFAFKPFCCLQQLKSGKPWIGFVFVCEVEDNTPVNQQDENRDVRWMDVSELNNIFNKNPEQIFTYQLGALDYYFKNFLK